MVSNNFHNRLIKAFYNLTIYKSYTSIEHKEHKEHKEHAIKALNNSAAIRTSYLKNNLEIIKKAPLIGHGVGSINTEFYKTKTYKNEISKTSEYIWDKECYNQFLNFYIQTGVIGISLYLLLLASMYRIKHLNSALGYIAKAFTITFTIGCMFNDYIGGFLAGYVFIIMTATLFAKTNTKENYYKLETFK